MYAANVTHAAAAPAETCDRRLAAARATASRLPIARTSDGTPEVYTPERRCRRGLDVDAYLRGGAELSS
jgi:hypothetical protein